MLSQTLHNYLKEKQICNKKQMTWPELIYPNLLSFNISQQTQVMCKLLTCTDTHSHSFIRQEKSVTLQNLFMSKAHMPSHQTYPGLIHALLTYVYNEPFIFFIHFVLQTSGKQKLLNKKKKLLFNSNNNYNSNNNN